MSKIRFSDTEVERLKLNAFVRNVSEKAITYTDEFKHYFIAEALNGKLTRSIFKEAGFDPDVLGSERMIEARRRWMKAYNNDGVLGLRDTRKVNSGRPSKKELTIEDQLVKKNAEIAYLKAELELIKKLDLKERQVKKGKLEPKQIFRIIHQLIHKFKLRKITAYLCNVSGVSRSGYYRFIKSDITRVEREQSDTRDRDIILSAISYRGYKKGSRSIYMTLINDFSIRFNRKKIQRLMRKYEIYCPIRAANPYKRMAKATKEHRVVPNILNRNFKQNIAGKVLLTDITYIPYQNNFAYLSTVKDGSTNEILAYHLSDNLKIEIVLETIKKLVNNTDIKLHKDAFIHSDQGAHYTSPKFQELLKVNGLGQSMSRRGNCWDNAPQESFYGHMKDNISIKSCTSLEELESIISDYMDYYNNYRYQWNLKKLTPIQYRNQLCAA